jgi:ParB-like chromosome segregation protein Spo0J
MKKLQIIYVDPKKLKHFPGNPRIMPDNQMDALNRDVNRFGYVEPLVVRQGNEVVGGNQRLDEALAAKRKEVPIVRICVNDREAKALNLALNKIHGEWNEGLLAPMLAELKDLPEISLTGFEMAEVTKILEDNLPDFAKAPQEFDEKLPVKNKCPQCGFEW